MRYTVGKISGQSGLAAQTIRDYADRGMLTTQVNEDTGYRYFDADAVNRTSAIRRLRMMGFPLSQVEHIIAAASRAQYEHMLDELIIRQEAELSYRKDVLDFLRDHRQNVADYERFLNRGDIVTQPTFLCLDYRRNGELLCQKKKQQELLNGWMAQSLFVRNYSPYPISLLEGGTADHIIGFIIEERYARYVPLDAPVFRRGACMCARFTIQHDDSLFLLPEGPAFIRDFLDANCLRVAGEPFFIGELPFYNSGIKTFYGTLYVPIHHINTPR